MVDIPHYFKLDRDPFLNEGVEGLFFPGGRRAELLEELIHHARYNNGLLAVCGDQGIGKTTILDVLFDSVGEDTDVATIVANPMMDENQFAAAVMMVLGESSGDIDALAQLTDFLSNTAECDRLLLVLVDDAHNLPAETVIGLNGIQTRYKDLFHLVFFTEQVGSWLEQLAGEIVFQTWVLEPYSYSQMLEYLSYRMETAGWRGKQPFSDQQLKYIFGQSGGNPLRINQLATDTLYGLMADATKRPVASRLPLILGATLGLTLFFILIIYWPGDKTMMDNPVADIEIPAGKIQRESGELAEDQEQQKNVKTVALPPPLVSPKKTLNELKKAPLDKSIAQTALELRSSAQSVKAADTENRNGESVNEDVNNDQIDKPAASLATTDTSSSGSLPKLAKNTERDESKEQYKSAGSQSKPVAEPGPSSSPKLADKPKLKVKPSPAPVSAPVAKEKKKTVVPKKSPYSQHERQLLARPADHYVIQLVGMSDRKRLDDYIRQLPKGIESKYYRRDLKGKMLYMVVTGEFASSADAQKGIDRLPTKLRKQKPWAKRLALVHKEIVSR